MVYSLPKKSDLSQPATRYNHHHIFDEDLHCECGVVWHEHDADPQHCAADVQGAQARKRAEAKKRRAEEEARKAAEAAEASEASEEEKDADPPSRPEPPPAPF